MKSVFQKGFINTIAIVHLDHYLNKYVYKVHAAKTEVVPLNQRSSMRAHVSPRTFTVAGRNTVWVLLYTSKASKSQVCLGA